MGIQNKTMDASEQQEAFTFSATNPVNAQDILVKIVERACTVKQATATLLGISGAPNVLFKVLRFVAGTGGSSFVLGSTFAVTAFGTSGFQSYSLLAVGSSQLNLQKGDAIVVVAGGGSGAASTALMGEVVVQNVQDIKTWY